MTVTVVRGSSGRATESAASGPTQNSQIQAQAQAQNAAVQGASVAVAANNEASVSVIRLARSSTGAERVRDSTEARRLADKVADRLKTDSDERGLDAHSELTPTRTREHFSA